MALTEKLGYIADAIRAKTGRNESMTLAQMASEISSIQVGAGETFPEKIYETDFVMDESVTANGSICSIITGLDENRVKDGNELFMCVITCEPSVTPSDRWVKKMIQFIYPNQGNTATNTYGFYIHAYGVDNESRRSFNSAVGAYIYTLSQNMSQIVIYARFNSCPPAVGNYHLEIYRLGVVV